MKKYFIIFLIISIILAIVTYLALDNIICCISIFLVSLAISIFIFIPRLEKFSKVIDRYHETYHFINNFIISLSIKNSVSAALENTVLSMGPSFDAMYTKLEDLTEDDKINYLESYFPFYSYKLFLQIIHLWENEGGDVLRMSEYLLSEIRYEEDYVSTISSLAKRKYIENGTLWFICISILILLRFTLNDFYLKIKNQIIFIICIMIIMLFILVSIYLLINKATSVELKGYKAYEKII